MTYIYHFLINYQRFVRNGRTRRNDKIWCFLNASQEQKSLLIFIIKNFQLIFVLPHLSNLRWLFDKTYNFEDIRSFPWILIFNLTGSVYNIRCLKWSLEGVQYYCKNMKFFKKVGKNYLSDFAHTWYELRKIQYVQMTCFSWLNEFRQRWVICLKSISIAANHCVTL